MLLSSYIFEKMRQISVSFHLQVHHRHDLWGVVLYYPRSVCALHTPPKPFKNLHGQRVIINYNIESIFNLGERVLLIYSNSEIVFFYGPLDVHVWRKFANIKDISENRWESVFMLSIFFRKLGVFLFRMACQSSRKYTMNLWNEG